MNCDRCLPPWAGCGTAPARVFSITRDSTSRAWRCSRKTIKPPRLNLVELHLPQIATLQMDAKEFANLHNGCVRSLNRLCRESRRTLNLLLLVGQSPEDPNRRSQLQLQ